MRQHRFHSNKAAQHRLADFHAPIVFRFAAANDKYNKPYWRDTLSRKNRATNRKMFWRWRSLLDIVIGGGLAVLQCNSAYRQIESR